MYTNVQHEMLSQSIVVELPKHRNGDVSIATAMQQHNSRNLWCLQQVAFTK